MKMECYVIATGKRLPTSEGIVVSSYLIMQLHTSLTDVILTHMVTVAYTSNGIKNVPFHHKYSNTQCCSTQQTVFCTHLLKNGSYFSGLKGINKLRYKTQ